MSPVDLRLSALRAFIGEIPSTLRFIYLSFADNRLSFKAVFDSTASDAHLECASTICAEILSDCPPDSGLDESIVRNSGCHWKEGDGTGLVYLRFGEMDRG
jgi:hypothetical protein